MLQPLAAQSFSTAFIATATGKTPQAVVKRGRKVWEQEPRRTQGGGIIWKFASLDEEVQEKVTLAVMAERRAAEESNPEVTKAHEAYMAAQWAAFEKKPNSVKDRAAHRYELLFEAWQLHMHGTPLTRAFILVANQHGVSVGNLRNWYYGTKKKAGVHEVDPKDWLPILADNYKGRVKYAPCTEKAWEYFLKDYLRREKPSFSMCYERLERIAAVQSWEIPSEQTLRRRLKRDFGPAERDYARDGSLRFAYPYQERKRDTFYAGEAVSGDALNFDDLHVVNETTGEVFTPRVWFFEDIYSAKILAWEPDVSENADMFRRSFYNLTAITLPRWLTIDNTRAASNKSMGGQLPRNRFTTKSTDPVGILKLMGVDVHRTNPDKDQTSSGSNPSERGFGIGGLHERMRAWPAFIGRGTGMNNPIPFSEFVEALPHIVAEHNAKTGRTGGVCNGRSFDEVFAASYQESKARKPSASLRNLLLYSQESCKVGTDGTVKIKAGQGDTKHRYYADFLAHLAGEYIAVMFNPDSLSDPVNIYSLNGKHLGIADWLPSVAFNDTETARRHAKNRARRNKAVKKQVKAAQAMSNDEFKMLNATVPIGATPEPAQLTTVMSPQEVEALLTGKHKVSTERQNELRANMHRNISALG
jgi:hypothetical protein